MARSAVFDSLAPLVDYLKGDSQVSLSTLADYLTTEDENRQVSLSGLVDAAQRGYRPQSKFEQDVVKPTMDFAIDKMAPKIGEMAKATPAGIGAIVTEDIPAMVDMADPLAGSSTQRQAAGRQAGAAVREGISGLADLIGQEGPMEVATRGLRAAGEGIGQQVDERGFAALVGPEDLVPGGKFLAALGMAAPAMRMGKGSNLLSDVTPDVDYTKTSKYTPGERISTRFPTAVKRTEDPLTENLIVDTDVMQRDPLLVSKTGETLAKYPNIQRGVVESGDPNKIISAMKEHDKANLDFIFEQMPAEIRDRSMMWYDGANQIANQFSSRYDIALESASGVLAALSPQMDWFKNVNLAERVLDTVKNQNASPWTPEMEEYITGKFYNAPASKRSKDWRPTIDAIRGKALQDIEEPIEKALWIRAYDETIRDRGYRVITPEGDFSSVVTKADGNPAAAGWGSFVDIAKAVSVIDNPSTENISRSMGLQHKVRNFYNNISDPRAPYGDVTMDTHAIAASLLRPLSGKSVEVNENLGGGPSSSVLGIEGSPYPVHADAYREIAAERGILPREMQSVTWEGVRGLYSPEQKRNKAFVASIDDLFAQYREGKIPLENVQQQVLQIAGGITLPEWAK